MGFLTLFEANIQGISSKITVLYIVSPKMSDFTKNRVNMHYRTCARVGPLHIQHVVQIPKNIKPVY